MSAYGGGYSDTTKPKSTSSYAVFKDKNRVVDTSNKTYKVFPVPNYSEAEIANQRPYKFDKPVGVSLKKSNDLTENKLKDIESAKKVKKEYILSDLYKKRLQGYYSNPNDIIKERLTALQNVNAKVNPLISSQTDVSKNEIIYNINDEKPTFSHELSHQTGAALKVRPMSSLEKNEFFIRNKNLDTTTRLAAMKGTLQIPQSDIHKISPAENKADLDAFRGLLLDNGITKKFGENIDLNILKKALQNKNISEDKHIKRMLENFSKKDIVELNNIIAKQEKVVPENLA